MGTALNDAQIILAGNLASRRLIARAAEMGSFGVQQPDELIDSVIAKLVELDPNLINDSVISSVAEKLRHVFDERENFGSEIRSVLDRSEELTFSRNEAAGWGGDAALLVISVGFAISMIIIASQVSIKGKIGDVSFEKAPGIPKELVTIVHDLSNAAAKAVRHEPED